MPTEGSSLRSALTSSEVWRAALPVGLCVGLLQIAINHGDRWLAGDVTHATVVKSLLTPAASLFVALLSAARQHANRT